MKHTTSSPVAPEGYSTVSPYLMVNDVSVVLAFLKDVFGAEVKETLREADGSVAHAEARLDESIIMMGKARQDYPALPASVYVFTRDVDATYARAIAHGATSLMEPGNRYYGYREGGVRDSQGIQWWMAQEAEKLTEAEMQRRLLARTQ